MAAALVGGGVALPPAASGTPQDDFNAVYRDWRPDRDVSPCVFSRTRLRNALDVVRSLGDAGSYFPGFADEVNVEISRWDVGGCPGVTRPSRLSRVSIVRLSPRGGARRESVTIRNAGSRTVSLTNATLRDRARNRLRFPRGLRLGARRSLKVVTGCARGRRRATRRGSTLYACGRRTLWDDRGDVVRLVDPRGVVISQRGYGRHRNARRL
jgi:hypothetical protein